MYLIDTNVISELRKKQNANSGVLKFFNSMQDEGMTSYLSVITLGELRRGVEKIESESWQGNSHVDRRQGCLRR